jgi:hypothetical protein
VQRRAFGEDGRQRLWIELGKISKASGLRVSSSFASGSTGIQIATVPPRLKITSARSVLELARSSQSVLRYKLERAGWSGGSRSE